LHERLTVAYLLPRRAMLDESSDEDRTGQTENEHYHPRDRRARIAVKHIACSSHGIANDHESSEIEDELGDERLIGAFHESFLWCARANV
jgi:hypothetical protein